MAAIVLASLPARASPRRVLSDDALIHPRLELRDPEPLAPYRATPRQPSLWVAVELNMLHRSMASVAGADAPHLQAPTAIGGLILVGVPIERLAMRARRASSTPVIAEAPASDRRGGARPAPAPAQRLKPARQAKLEAPAPSQEKLPARPAAEQAPLRVPIIVTPAAARAAVDAALRHARLARPDARIVGMTSRARGSAALPELRLRVSRTVDEGQGLSPTEYDPTRTTATGGTSLWLEARATWRLDRLVFADEEVALERIREGRAAARARVVAAVLRSLFAWQRALAHTENPNASLEERLAATLKVIEAEAELALMTDGWFTKWRATQTER